MISHSYKTLWLLPWVSIVWTVLTIITTTTTNIGNVCTARTVEYDNVYIFQGPIVLDEVWQFANVSQGDSIVALITGSASAASVTLPLANVITPSTAAQQMMTVIPTSSAVRNIRSSCPLPEAADATSLITNVRINITSRFERAYVVYQITRNASLPLDGTLKTFDTCTKGAASMVLYFDVTSAAAGLVELYAQALNTTVVLYVEPQCNTTWFTSTAAMPPYDIFAKAYVGYPNMMRVVAMTNKRMTLNLPTGVGRYYVHVLGALSDCIWNNTQFSSSRVLFQISACQGATCSTSTNSVTPSTTGNSLNNNTGTVGVSGTTANDAIETVTADAIVMSPLEEWVGALFIGLCICLTVVMF